MDKMATRNDFPMKPQVPAYELGKRLQENAIISSDSGTNTTWWARHIPAKRGESTVFQGLSPLWLWTSLCNCCCSGAFPKGKVSPLLVMEVSLC